MQNDVRAEQDVQAETKTAAEKPDERLLAIADHDLTVQSWAMQYLHVVMPELLQPAAIAAPIAAETIAGVTALLRLLFAESTAIDATSAKLWCHLSIKQLAAKLSRDKKTVIGWLAIAEDRELSIWSPITGQRQRRRRRPRWDVIVPRINAAATASLVPQAPLFGEPMGGPALIERTGGVVPPVPLEPVLETGGTTPPVFEKPVAPRHRFDQIEIENLQKFRGGVRGGIPLKGDSPLTPASGERESKTGGTTPPVFQEVGIGGTQLTLEFEERVDDRLEALLDGQGEARTLLQQMFTMLKQLCGGAAPVKPSRSGARGRRTDLDPARGLDLATHIRRLHWREREPLLKECAAMIGPRADEFAVYRMLETGSPEMINAVAAIAARGKR
jgi:hypothetical protein